ncbi:NAD(P)/FAD-dependent oxidoreductase [Bradyrhizobium sp. INPA01-394B]|uniref:NAD(P)/FAD-dependent oxidoreductase n=1 Tax=Bradyrhizobium campsiandrae TaxID=1729892 RepID=A0ABR7TZ43_9BRAD|nr:NAD(P)/FAD-dependent oxidoreductase [Bradyrhizobium campsiandrae]MBC9877315.1 NAD(P)/FAD-dependent oxidoreductase [Bradyrhizobium campsiandrae]MBC9976605.1 NAD(P)/FAD-dependent oxidoreductase [Bradyrhizobium campsiandrae]
MLGAGPAGAVVAMVLGRRGVRVLVVDDGRQKAFSGGETLPGASRPILGGLGLTDVLDRTPTLPCTGSRSAWGSDELAMRPGIMSAYGAGLHIDRPAFDTHLRVASLRSGASALKGRLSKVDRDDRGWIACVGSDGGQITVKCQWVFDCSGRRSIFARAVGAVRRAADKQVAVVAVAERSGHDDDLATTTESVSEGWWYSAQLPRDRRVFMLFTDGDLLTNSGARSIERFVALGRQTRHISELMATYEFGRIPPTVVLADSSSLDAAAGPGWLAVGDAAASMDPLASTGIIDALKSGRMAAEVLLGSGVRLEDYSRAILERYSQNLRLRSRYHWMEKRWSGSDFWRRRRIPFV